MVSSFTRFKYYCYNKFNKYIRAPYSEEENIKGKLFWILSKPLFCFKSKNYYSLKFEKLNVKQKITSKNNILFVWRIPLISPYENVFDYSMFNNYKDVKFEDTTIRVPIDYDGYLKKDFGDYMKLPPEEKRQTHKPVILDLKKSYIEYAKEKRDEKNECNSK